MCISYTSRASDKWAQYKEDKEVMCWLKKEASLFQSHWMQITENNPQLQLAAVKLQMGTVREAA